MFARWRSHVVYGLLARCSVEMHEVAYLQKQMWQAYISLEQNLLEKIGINHGNGYSQLQGKQFD